MSTRNGECFDGSSTLLDVHDFLQVLDCNATWINQFSTVIVGPQKRIAETVMALSILRVVLCKSRRHCYVYRRYTNRSPWYNNCIHSLSHTNFVS